MLFILFLPSKVSASNLQAFVIESDHIAALAETLPYTLPLVLLTNSPTALFFQGHLKWPSIYSHMKRLSCDPLPKVT